MTSNVNDPLSPECVFYLRWNRTTPETIQVFRLPSDLESEYPTASTPQSSNTNFGPWDAKVAAAIQDPVGLGAPVYTIRPPHTGRRPDGTGFTVLHWAISPGPDLNSHTDLRSPSPVPDHAFPCNWAHPLTPTGLGEIRYPDRINLRGATAVITSSPGNPCSVAGCDAGADDNRTGVTAKLETFSHLDNVYGWYVDNPDRPSTVELRRHLKVFDQYTHTPDGVDCADHFDCRYVVVGQYRAIPEQGPDPIPGLPGLNPWVSATLALDLSGRFTEAERCVGRFFSFTIDPVVALLTGFAAVGRPRR